MKYIIFLWFVCVGYAQAQNRVFTQPCYLRANSLGTAVQSTILFTPYIPEPFANMPAKVDLGYYYAVVV